jgi:hypothetical protein
MMFAFGPFLVDPASVGLTGVAADRALPVFGAADLRT